MRKAKKTDETVIAEAVAVEMKEASAVAPAGGETARIKEFWKTFLLKWAWKIARWKRLKQGKLFYSI